MAFPEKRSDLENKYLDLATRHLKDTPFFVYDLKYDRVKKVLTIFIANDKMTASLDDCVYVDNLLTPALESSDLPDGFILQISSPGIERRIVNLDQLNKHLFSKIVVTFRKDVVIYNSKKLVGRLEAIEVDHLLLDGRSIDFMDIKEIRNCL